MKALNRDVIVALALLVGCAVFIQQSFAIEETTYGTMQSSVWPQVILVVLTLFSLALLWQALRHPPEAPQGVGGGFVGWLRRYRNALLCYLLFLAFLLTLPILGMLLGGSLFVFATLTLLGRPTLRLVPLHLAVSVVSIGVMWAIFTFGLRVFLPEGVILPY